MIWIKADDIAISTIPQTYTDIGHKINVNKPPLAWLYIDGQFIIGPRHKEILDDLKKELDPVAAWKALTTNWRGRFDFEKNMVSVEKLIEVVGKNIKKISEPDESTKQAIKTEYESLGGEPIDGEWLYLTTETPRIIAWKDYNNWLKKICQIG